MRAAVAMLCLACGAAPVDDAGVDAGFSLDARLHDAGDPHADGFRLQYTRAVCDLFQRCESYLGSGSIRRVYQPAWCHPGNEAGGRLDAALEAGTVVYDAEAATRCLRALESVQCADFADELGRCHDEVWQPTLPANGACAIDEECIDGRCLREAECPGRCVAYGAVSAPCTDAFFDCRPELACVSGACAERRAVGESCTNGGECAEGLLCRASVCAERPTLGEACEGSRGSGSDCAGSLVCVGGMCAEGATSGDCFSTPCAEGYRCDEDTLQCIAVAPPGGACTLDAQCPFTFFCDRGRCTALPIAGELCGEAPICAEGVCMDGRCTLVEEGGDCSAELDPRVFFDACASGLYCGSGSVCTQRLAEGADCTTIRYCIETHECRDGFCRPRCIPGT